MKALLTVEEGARIGRWTVLCPAPKRGYAEYWNCRCDCGVEREVFGRSLKHGLTRSCGCLRDDRTRERQIAKTEVRAGSKWGRWTVLEDTPSRRYYRLCRCHCGTEREVVLSALLSGRSASCGCASGKKQRTSRRQFANHGGTNTPTWRSWISMVQRCTQEGEPQFSDYGGRGITICDRWLHGDGTRGGFECFLADMGERPQGHSLDRFPDVNGNYEPGNCRWASRTQQSRNRRDTLFLTHAGETRPLVEWAERQGLPMSRVHGRLHNGWSKAQAVGFAPPPSRMSPADRKNARLITHAGETMTLGQWATRAGTTSAHICTRLNRGWSMADALTLPKQTKWSRRQSLHKGQS